MTNYNERLDGILRAFENYERWADWQRYVHSVCYENKGIGGEPTGELTIPSEFAGGWERQIETPYHELSEKEKDSYREQVDRYWRLITADRKRVALEARIDERQMLNFHRAYGKDYQATLEMLEEANDDRIAELKAQQEEV